jgi:stearoyl-CoA desaturase (delta-9 desaturase)
VTPEGEHGIDWLRAVPFLALHLGCLAVLWVGWSPVAVAVAVALYVVRMFAITGFYHRYFSHRAFRTGRAWQFVFAVLGNSAVQRGPLWWAAHHRHHHRVSDSAEDMHSPRTQGFLRSHVGWILHAGNFRTRLELVPDLAKFPELRFLDRFDALVPLLLGVGLFALGSLLAALRPEWHTSGWQIFVWGFVISTVVTSHATFTINSLSHLLGTRRYETGDDSRNNPLLALLTFGEGWHNNHHRFPGSVRQGFYWWELDLTWLGLMGLRALGIVRDLNPVPVAAFEPRARPRR